MNPPSLPLSHPMSFGIIYHRQESKSQTKIKIHAEKFIILQSKIYICQLRIKKQWRLSQALSKLIKCAYYILAKYKAPMKNKLSHRKADAWTIKFFFKPIHTQLKLLNYSINISSKKVLTYRRRPLTLYCLLPGLHNASKATILVFLLHMESIGPLSR